MPEVSSDNQEPIVTSLYIYPHCSLTSWQLQSGPGRFRPKWMPGLSQNFATSRPFPATWISASWVTWTGCCSPTLLGSLKQTQFCHLLLWDTSETQYEVRSVHNQSSSIKMDGQLIPANCNTSIKHGQEIAKGEMYKWDLKDCGQIYTILSKSISHVFLENSHRALL